jgi:hypothetical protein
MASIAVARGVIRTQCSTEGWFGQTSAWKIGERDKVWNVRLLLADAQISDHRDQLRRFVWLIDGNGKEAFYGCCDRPKLS